MPGTRTAPTVDGTPTSTVVTLHTIDASGDLYANSYKTTSQPTDAAVEALANAYQAASNASLYKVSITVNYYNQPDPSQAVAAYRGSIASGINMLYADAIGNTQTPRLVAPIAGLFVQDTDTVLVPLATELSTLVTTQNVLLGVLNYNLISMQYTERRERKNNPRTKV